MMKSPMRRKKWVSLKTVFTVPFVIIIVTTVGLTGYLGYLNGQGAVNVLASQLHREVTVSAEQRLDSYLSTALVINQLNLDEINSGQLNVSDFNVLQQHFLAQMLRFDSVKSIAFANEQNDYIGPVRNVLGENLVLGISNNGTNHRLEVYGIDSHGNRLAYLGGSAQGYDVRSRPWYQAAVQAGIETWTPIYIWTNSTDIGLDAVVPVYKEGKLAGVLDTSLTLNSISDFLQTLNATDREQIMIVEPSGLLVASSSIKPYTTSGSAYNRFSAFDSNNTLIRATVQDLRQQFGNLSNIKGSDQFYFSAAGEQQLAEVLPYQDKYGLNWLIMVVTPESDYMSQINASNVNTGLIVVVSLLACAVMVTSMTARWVTKPLSRLNQSAKALANGDWTQKVVIDRRDEVGELASSFNHMAEHLDASFSSLQASERRYRELFDLQPDTIIVSDLEGNILDANSAMETRTGHGREELLHMNLKQLADQETVARFPERIKMIVDEGSASFEVKSIGKEGVIRDLEVRGRLVDHEGNRAIMLVTRDITERRKSEEAIRREKNFSASLLESLPGVVYLKDATGKFLRWNKNLESLSGYSADEIKRVNEWGFFWAEEDKALIQQKAQEAFEKGSATSEGTFVTKNGTRLPHIVTALRVEFEGKPCLVGIAIDIGERKRLEEQLRLHSEHLEELVDSKVRELKEVNDRLVKVERMAAIGEMAAMLGHDIRNPLQSIIGATDNLETRLDPSNTQTSKMLAIIKDGVDYSNQIINDLLDFSRELRLELSRSTPQAIVRETIAHLVVPANIKVSDRTEERPIVNIDRGKMRRALQHVIENAIQAMPGGGEVTISSKPVGSEVEFVITDTGIGMTEDVLEKIFTPLFTTKAKGIGLGLAISRRIIEAHGGSISVESKVGEGSCIRLKIPINPNRKEADIDD